MRQLVAQVAGLFKALNDPTLQAVTHYGNIIQVLLQVSPLDSRGDGRRTHGSTEISQQVTTRSHCSRSKQVYADLPRPSGELGIILHADDRIHDLKLRLDDTVEVDEHLCETVGILQPCMIYGLFQSNNDFLNILSCARYEKRSISYDLGYDDHYVAIQYGVDNRELIRRIKQVIKFWEIMKRCLKLQNTVYETRSNKID